MNIEVLRQHHNGAFFTVLKASVRHLYFAKGQSPRGCVGSLPCMFALAQSLRDRLRRIPGSVCRP
ncbi:MAG: hypothetical protein RR907_00995, partial [Comamonas sp.]